MYAALYRVVFYVLVAVFAIQIAFFLAMVICWLLDYAFVGGGA